MYKTCTYMSLVVLLFCAPLAQGKDYAVLISAGNTTADDAAVNSSFWYDLYLQYTALLEGGYGDDDIRKIAGENLMRVWSEVERVARAAQSGA